MKSYLKIKVKSLAEEAKIISHSEQRWLKKARINRAKQAEPKYAEQNYFGLRQHRINELRKEARSAHIAYSFLRGNTYQDIEQFSFTQPDWTRIRKLVLSYSEFEDTLVKFEEWKIAALRGCSENNHFKYSQPRSSIDYSWTKVQQKPVVRYRLSLEEKMERDKKYHNIRSNSFVKRMTGKKTNVA